VRASAKACEEDGILRERGIGRMTGSRCDVAMAEKAEKSRGEGGAETARKRGTRHVTVSLVTVDLSIESIGWRKRRSAEFHGNYLSNNPAIHSRPLAACADINKSRISRFMLEEDEEDLNSRRSGSGRLRCD